MIFHFDNVFSSAEPSVRETPAIRAFLRPEKHELRFICVFPPFIFALFFSLSTGICVEPSIRVFNPPTNVTRPRVSTSNLPSPISRSESRREMSIILGSFSRNPRFTRTRRLDQLARLVAQKITPAATWSARARVLFIPARGQASGNKTAKSRRFGGARYKWKSAGSVRVVSGADPFFLSPPAPPPPPSFRYYYLPLALTRVPSRAHAHRDFTRASRVRSRVAHRETPPLGGDGEEKGKREGERRSL